MMTNDISYLLGFFSFIQLSVALNFGFLFFTKTHKANKLQKEWIDYLRNHYRTKITNAEKEYSRVREGMDQSIIGQKNDLKNHVKAFDNIIDTEDLSVFMPEIGFTSCLYGMLLLLFLPTWAKGNIIVRSDLWAIITQILLFFQCVDYFFLCNKDVVACWKPTFRKMMDDKWKRREIIIVLSIFSFIAFFSLYKLGLTCQCLTPEIILYISIITSYSPILFYLISLYQLYKHRKNKINEIEALTADLSERLKKRMG